MLNEDYALLIDDEIYLETAANILPKIGIPWAHARSTGEAKGIVIKRGMPKYISFDYQLRDQDISIKFLTWLTKEYWNENTNAPKVPMFQVHCGTPEQKTEIQIIMKAWQEYSK